MTIVVIIIMVITILAMSFHLVAHLPGFVCWGGEQLLSIALLYAIILLYYHIISHYHIRVKLLQSKVMAPPV